MVGLCEGKEITQLTMLVKGYTIHASNYTSVTMPIYLYRILTLTYNRKFWYVSITEVLHI